MDSYNYKEVIDYVPEVIKPLYIVWGQVGVNIRKKMRVKEADQRLP